MTEADARKTVASLVSPAALDCLDRFVDIVMLENERQNLIGRSTAEVMWQRHILDSIQLLTLVDGDWRTWMDIGTGGGFPGLAIACVVTQPITLVEPRTRRADFLTAAAEHLGLGSVHVVRTKVQQLVAKTDVISARAVAQPFSLLQQAKRCATRTSQWILPVGRWSEGDTRLLAAAFPTMTFHVERSLTQTNAAVLIGFGSPS